SRGDGVRIRRRGVPQRAAQRALESAASFGPRLSCLDGSASDRPGFRALAVGVAAHDCFPMADRRRDIGNSRRGLDLPHPARALTRHIAAGDKIRENQYWHVASDDDGLKPQTLPRAAEYLNLAAFVQDGPKRKTARDATHFHRSVQPSSI